MDDAKVERHDVPDTTKQLRTLAEGFLKEIPYWKMPFPHDELEKKFGASWEDIRNILEEQGITTKACDVCVERTLKSGKTWSIGIIEEMPGYFFEAKRDEEGKIINPILRTRYEVAMAKAQEIASGYANPIDVPEIELIQLWGEDWKMVYFILQKEMKFSCERYKEWKHSGFLGLKKEFVGWRCVVANPRPTED